MENIEIERKFLVKEMPDNLDNYDMVDMTQGYLNTNPVVRIRKENDVIFSVVDWWHAVSCCSFLCRIF